MVAAASLPTGRRTTRGPEPYTRAMDLEDATLTICGEAAAHPDLAAPARSVFEQLARDRWVDYRVLSYADAGSHAQGRDPLAAA